MKWSDVVITDEVNKDYTGSEAWKFVKYKCQQPLAIDTTFEGEIKVNTYSPAESTKDKDVKSFLFTKLKGKAKSIRFFTKDNSERAFLPVARAIKNVIVINETRLKVEFIYKQDLRSSTKIYLKDPVVSVTVNFAGNKHLPPKTTKWNAKDGVVDLGVVPYGRYTLTPDYSNLEPCKFDFEVNPQVVDLDPGDDITEIFEVEPLYQKVQLVAHCLLAIPDLIFIPTENDKKKLEITEADGKKTYKYKEIPVDLGRFEIKDLSSALLGKAAITADSTTGIGILTMKLKKPLAEYYKYNELPQDVRDKLEVVREYDVPDAYEVKFTKGTLTDFNTKFKGKAEFSFTNRRNRVVPTKPYTMDNLISDTIGEMEVLDDLRAASFQIKCLEKITDPELKAMLGKVARIERNPGGLKLVMEPKARQMEYWKKDDLDDKALDPVMITIVQKVSDNPEVYDIELNRRPASAGENDEKPAFKDEDLKGVWRGKYHGLYEDKEDMNTRIKLVTETLKCAYTKANNDPTILKVFMLPECYFQGRYGTYRVDEGDHLLTNMLNLVGGVQWRDWMFVFGTVNLTFSEGTPGIDEGIREMMNYSPVIRGGLGPADQARGSGGQKDQHYRLIQKLINSAELLDKDQLINHADEKREPSVNDDVQFQATENEEIVGRILERAFFGETLFKLGSKVHIPPTDPNFGADKGLSAEKWKQLKSELEDKISELGLTRVVRSIRICKIEGKPPTLSGWGDFSGYEDKKEAQREPASWINVTWKKLLLEFILKGWSENFGNTPKFADGWREAGDTGGVRRKDVLEHVKKNFNDLIKPLEITLPYQKDILKNKIQELLDDDQKALLFADITWEDKLIEFIKEGWGEYFKLNKPDTPPQFETGWKEAGDTGAKWRKDVLEYVKKNFDVLIMPIKSIQPYQKDILKNKIQELLDDDQKAVLFTDSTAKIPINFAASIYPLWKKILELYFKEKKHDVLLTPASEEMDLHDYCFASRRKAGPLLTLEEVASLEPCKKLIFGHEICADHAKGRLRSLVQEPLPVFEGVFLEEPEKIADNDIRFTKEEREKKNAEYKKIREKNISTEKDRVRIEKGSKEVQERNEKKPKVFVDIQLLPSAGMFPGKEAVVARKGGYCFNCDGWNKGRSGGVNFIEAWFEGPEYNRGTMANPVTPHTAIAKGGGVSLDMASFKLQKIKLETVIDSALGKGILSQQGLGELHIYEEIDLPK